jgi:hypothetical protein
MTHHCDDLARFERLAGAHNVFDERPASGAMQNFRQRGFQARALAGRQNHYRKIRICHACIVSVSAWIDNARELPAVRNEYFREGCLRLRTERPRL